MDQFHSGCVCPLLDSSQAAYFNSENPGGVYYRLDLHAVVQFKTISKDKINVQFSLHEHVVLEYIHYTYNCHAAQ